MAVLTRTRRLPAAERSRLTATGHLADYERLRYAYDKLVREEPQNLIGITLVGMDLDRARRALLGLPQQAPTPPESSSEPRG